MKKILFILFVILVNVGFSQTNILSTKYISKLSDFPEQIGGVRTLLPNTNYVVDGQIVLDYPLVLQDGTSLRGTSVSYCRLTWTGDSAMLRGTDNSSVIRALQLIATGGTNTCILDFKNLARDKNISLLDNFYMQSDSIGNIKGYNMITLLTSAYLNNLKGLGLDSCYNIAFSTNYLSSSSGNVSSFLKFPTNAAYDGISINNNIFDTKNTLDTVIYFGNLNVNFAEISGNTFNKFTTNPIIGVNENTYPQIKLYSNNNIDNYVILPHYTDSYIASIPSPNKGSLVFNETTNDLNIYNGTNWYGISATILYTTSFEETFESGSFTTNGWQTSQSTTNLWYVGTADAYAGTYAAYISNDGGTTNAYTNNATRVSHLYIDLLMPNATNDIQIEFRWKCLGEVGYDGAQVYYGLPTDFTPTANTQVSSTYFIGSTLNNKSTWQTFGQSVGVAGAGTTRRICISWINDYSYGTNPPIIIDNFKINYY